MFTFKRKIIALLVCAVMLFGLPPSSLLIVSADDFELLDRLAFDRSKDNLFINGEFETLSLLGFEGNSTLAPGAGIDGGNAVLVPTTGSMAVIQGLTTLKPNTEYTYAAYMKLTDATDGPGVITIKNNTRGHFQYPDCWVITERVPDVWHRLEFTFTTGPDFYAPGEKVDFHVWNPSSGPMYVDSMFLYENTALSELLDADKSRKNLIINGEFTDGDLSMFAGGSVFYIESEAGIGGSKAASVPAGGWIAQTVTGLKDNTVYTYAVYLRDPGAATYAVIAAPDEPMFSYAAPSQESGYQRVAGKFETGDGASGIPYELKVWNVSGGDILVDSMFLYTETSVIDRLAFDRLKTNLIYNGEFETANLGAFEGNPSFAPGEGIDGVKPDAVSVPNYANAAILQGVTALKPNTEYTYAAYVKMTDASAGPCNLVVKNKTRGWLEFPGSWVISEMTEDEWQRLEYVFTTASDLYGAGEIVEFHVYNPSAGPVYVDSMFLYENPKLLNQLAVDRLKNNLINNGEFINGLGSFAGSGKSLAAGMGIDGGNAVTVTVGNGIYCDMTGLIPNAEYTFAAYLKMSDYSGWPATLVLKEKTGGDWPVPCWNNCELNDEWQRLEYVYTAGADSSLALDLSVWNESAGSILVDSMFFYTDAAADLGYYTILNNMESLKGWVGDGEPFDYGLEHEIKTEGNSSIRFDFFKENGKPWETFTWDLASNAGLQTAGILNAAQGVKFSNAKALVFDLYVEEVTPGGSEPLMLRIDNYRGSSNSDAARISIYEQPVRVTKAGWNTVRIPLGGAGWNRSPDNVTDIRFYIGVDDPKWNGRDKITYYIDNMRLEWDPEPKIAASVDSGPILRGGKLYLTGGGTIRYTANGANPTGTSTAYNAANGLTAPASASQQSWVITAGINGTAQPQQVFVYQLADAINTELKSAKPGNIFPSDEPVSFTLSYKNFTNAPITITNAAYTVTDKIGGDNIAPTNIGSAITVQPNSVYEIPFNINVSKNSVFTLTVNVNSPAGNETVRAEFSRVLPKTEDRADSFFGVGTHFGLGSGDPVILPELISLGGASMIRDEVRWDMVEKTKGVIEIGAYYDTYVDNALANGIETMIILAYGNPHYDSYGIPYTTEGRAAFVNYAMEVVKHFHGRIKVYEVWNEPNAPNFNPTNRGAADYVQLMKDVYTAVKAYDPEITVLGGSLASNGSNMIPRRGDIGSNSIFTLEDMMNAGAYGYMDALSVHPYYTTFAVTSTNINGRMQSAYDYMQGFADGGPAVPMWMTEIGWYNDGTLSRTEAQSAANLISSSVQAMAAGYADKYIWYEFQNGTTSGAGQEASFGLIRHKDDINYPWSAKFAYVAYSALTNKLTGAAYIGTHTISGGSGYKFERGSTDVYVAWRSSAGSVTVSSLGNGTAVVTDMYGNIIQGPAAITGSLSLSIGASPVYIEVVTEPEPVNFVCAVKTLPAKVGVNQKIAYLYSGPDSGKPEFTSSNAGICAVDIEGNLTPMKAGMAIITVRCGGVTMAIVVTVT